MAGNECRQGVADELMTMVRQMTAVGTHSFDGGQEGYVDGQS
jgi:hypothetical protein